MASYLDECANRKISLAPLVKAGKITFQDTMVYQELLYRIQVLETCKMLCKAAPITTNMNDLLLHYQLTDTILSCMAEERHMGFPTDDKGKAQRKTAVENFHRVLTDFRKRFSSFRAEKPEQYQQAISAMVNTVLPVWIQMRNTYVPIGNGGKNG